MRKIATLANSSKCSFGTNNFVPVKLPELKWEYKELAPILSTNLLSYHHGKHHQTYVTNLNLTYEVKEIQKTIQFPCFFFRRNKKNDCFQNVAQLGTILIEKKLSFDSGIERCPTLLLFFLNKKLISPIPKGE